jgi:hypothetical protein
MLPSTPAPFASDRAHPAGGVGAWCGANAPGTGGAPAAAACPRWLSSMRRGAPFGTSGPTGAPSTCAGARSAAAAAAAAPGGSRPIGPGQGEEPSGPSPSVATLWLYLQLDPRLQRPL